MSELDNILDTDITDEQALRNLMRHVKEDGWVKIWIAFQVVLLCGGGYGDVIISLSEGRVTGYPHADVRIQGSERRKKDRRATDK